MAERTHEQLRKRAVQWLTNTRHCGVVISEMSSAAWECPDAIGWQSSFSVLVECKISRSDFLRNGDKPTIRADRGVGNERYFMVPDGIVTKDDVEVRYPGYGLLVVGDNTVWQVLKPERRETNQASEICMLVSALRRVKTREFLIVNTCQCCESEAARDMKADIYGENGNG